MADNNSNMIRPVQGLQNMGSLKPVGKRKQKKEQKQPKQNKRQNNFPDEYSDDDFVQDSQEQNDESDGIDYQA